MNFEKDVFISYAHIDDKPISDGLSGWITEFHKSLEVRLSQVLGKEAKIWRDAKLQGNDFFAPEIEAQFPKLKIMISVITPRYLKSEWCTKEVDLFFKAAVENGGIAIDNKARIFKVIKTPVKREDQPEKIKPLLGYEFFRINKESNKITEFGLFEKEKEYWDALNDVAYNIKDLLEKLDTNNGNKSNGNPAAGFSAARRKVYLAESTSDLKEYRDKLKRELEDNGLLIFPDRHLEPVESIYKTEVTEMMNDCSLSIHLIGSTYGLVPEGSDKSIIAIQNDIAAIQSHSRDLDRLIWIPPGLKPAEDPRLLSFIDQLKHKEELQHGSDLLEGTIEEFKFAIFDTIKKLDAADLEKEKQNEAAQIKPSVTSVVSEEPKTIYLIYDQRDKDGIKVIDDFLYDLGYNTWPSVFEGSQEELAKAHEASLRDCDAALIYYGNANEAWLRTKISELKKKPALTGAKPLLSSIVYLAQPGNEQKTSYRSRDVNAVVNGLSGFNKESMNIFLEKLK